MLPKRLDNIFHWKLYLLENKVMRSKSRKKKVVNDMSMNCGRIESCNQSWENQNQHDQQRLEDVRQYLVCKGLVVQDEEASNSDHGSASDASAQRKSWRFTEKGNQAFVYWSPPNRCGES